MEVNVLIVVPWDQSRGGVATVVNNLATHLTGAGHNVLFFHPGDSDTARRKTTETGRPGVELNLRPPWISDHRVKSVVAFWLLLPRTTWRLHRLLRDHQIDVVSIHYVLPAFVYFGMCRIIRRFALVVTAHGADMMPNGQAPDKYSWGLRSVLRRCDQFTAPSRDYLESTLRILPSLRSKALFIHNGIDVSELAAPPAASPTSRHFVLCVAAHVRKKGVDVLLHALRLARSQGFSMRLVLVGDGPMRGDLERLTGELGVADQVQFAGSQALEGMRELLHGCAFFVLPSRAEPFGIAALEAMAVGKAVVASRVGGIPEFVLDGENGVLVEPDNPQALADALCLLENDALLRDRLGCAGKATVMAGQYTLERMGQNYLSLFERLIARADPR